jgi:hypothetical protein
MNEILAMIYNCFNFDCNETFLNYSEVDAFFCFTSLMGDIKDGFIRKMDFEKGVNIILLLIFFAIF